MMQEIFDAVKGLNKAQLIDEIEGFVEQCGTIDGKTDTDLVRKVQKLATDMCYDRYNCRELGIDYNTVSHTDYLRALLAAWYVVRD